MSVKVTNLMQHIKSDQELVAHEAKVRETQDGQHLALHFFQLRAQNLALLQSEALNALANAQVAANFAADAADVAKNYQVRRTFKQLFKPRPFAG